MNPLPDAAIACPGCGQLTRGIRLMSGNTFGGTFWSDGYADLPNNPSTPPVTRCRRCRHFFWLRDAQVKGEIPYLVCKVGAEPEPRADTEVQRSVGAKMRALFPHLYQGPAPPRTNHFLYWPRDAQMPEWLRPYAEVPIDLVANLSADDCREALAGGLARDSADEVVLRTLQWWRDNDPRRGETSSATPLLHGERDNLRRLLALHNGTSEPAGQLLRAEAARELGDFEAARGFLPATAPRALQAALDACRAAIEREDARLLLVAAPRPGSRPSG